MGLQMRPYAGDADLPLLADVIQASPSASRHRVDFPWRLSSPTFESPADVRLWTAPDGTLLGIAAWQLVWAALDFYVRPGPERSAVEDAIFAWSSARFWELDAARGRPLPYWVETRDDDHERLALLTRHGYTLDDDYAYVILRRPLDESLPRPELPAGFSIRPLAGVSEVDAYVALHRRAFASTSMTPEWRIRTLHMLQYRPELDLVATAPSGQLAGFCVGWLALKDHAGQVEPIGVDPAFQGHGLGRALLLEMFARFKECGADHALVETEMTRSPARRAYEAVGFRPVHHALRKGQWFS